MAADSVYCYQQHCNIACDVRVTCFKFDAKPEEED